MVYHGVKIAITIHRNWLCVRTNSVLKTKQLKIMATNAIFT